MCLFISECYPSHLGAQLSCRTPAGVKNTPAGDGVLDAKSISHMITHPPYSAVDVSLLDSLCQEVDVLVLLASSAINACQHPSTYWLSTISYKSLSSSDTVIGQNIRYHSDRTSQSIHPTFQWVRTIHELISVGAWTNKVAGFNMCLLAFCPCVLVNDSGFLRI